MTAQEARELTLSKRKTTEQIMNSIEAMAKSGNNYATINISEIKDTELSKTELTEMGYNVELTENHFNIKW